MRVIVCGSHFIVNEYAVWGALDRLHLKFHFSAIIHGKAPGIDTMAGQWARTRGIAEEGYGARWLDRIAGHRRNQEMLNAARPQKIIAFSGGPGTMDMKRRATIAGVPIIELYMVDGEYV